MIKTGKLLLTIVAISSMKLLSCEKEVISYQMVNIDTTKVYSFTNDVYPMFSQLNCTDCHGTSGDLDYSKSPSDIRAQLFFNSPQYGSRIDTLNPSDSKFYLLIKNKTSPTSNISHPQAFTQDNEINTLIWISQGAKDN